MDRNGPISLPLGLMTPTMAAAMSRTGSRVSRNIRPAKTISAPPAINMRLRPMRSAFVVMASEMAASPASARVNMSPIWVSLRPASARYSARMTDRKP